MGTCGKAVAASVPISGIGNVDPAGFTGGTSSCMIVAVDVDG